MRERNDKLQRADAVGRRLAGARRPRAFNHRRLVRTLLLGAAAVAAAIYWLATAYAVDMRELVGHLGFSILFIILFAALAGVGTIILRAVKRPLSKPGKPLK